MEAFSLLGETHGSYPDAKAAKTVLSSLSEILKVVLDLSKLDDIAEELQKKKFFNKDLTVIPEIRYFLEERGVQNCPPGGGLKVSFPPSAALTAIYTSVLCS
ncbi:hypothetical protein AKJ38_03810 [candidate division MSBL1 archaeon SCGC-AAA259I14]|uniref:Uncharacterized protein n=1 Tax=candidate division MSBL1 archaeon SCGC-AAA259I14 TaxID=1698268 RepID=A0A133UPP4_9EURY|nr:hypothetical protein AKJ38_03810 [candidate division MSBL1 archaeon SCGC-AAA259I14]